MYVKIKLEYISGEGVRTLWFHPLSTSLDTLYFIFLIDVMITINIVIYFFRNLYTHIIPLYVLRTIKLLKII